MGKPVVRKLEVQFFEKKLNFGFFGTRSAYMDILRWHLIGVPVASMSR